MTTLPDDSSDEGGDNGIIAHGAADFNNRMVNIEILEKQGGDVSSRFKVLEGH
jgi:hypothetical protein